MFEKRYSAVLVETEEHFVTLSRYVVLNPVRAGVVEHPGDWGWSSYCATVGDEPAPPFLTTELLLAQFHEHDLVRARDGYRRFVDDALRWSR